MKDKTGMKKKHISIRIDEGLLDIVDSRAAKNHRSRSWLIEHAVANEIANWPKEQRTVEFTGRTPEAIEEAVEMLITCLKADGATSSSAPPMPICHEANIKRMEHIQRGKYGMRLIEFCTIGNPHLPPDTPDYILRLDAIFGNSSHVVLTNTGEGAISHSNIAAY